MKRTILILLLIQCPIILAEKKRNWQIGKVIDTGIERIYAGNVYQDIPNSTVSTSNARYMIYHTYAIEHGDYFYVAMERLKWIWSKGANLTVNDEVKFAIENDKLYVIGEDEKEHEAIVTKKIKKQK